MEKIYVVSRLFENGDTDIVFAHHTMDGAIDELRKRAEKYNYYDDPSKLQSDCKPIVNVQKMQSGRLAFVDITRKNFKATYSIEETNVY